MSSAGPISGLMSQGDLTRRLNLQGLECFKRLDAGGTFGLDGFLMGTDASKAQAELFCQLSAPQENQSNLDGIHFKRIRWK